MHGYYLMLDDREEEPSSLRKFELDKINYIILLHGILVQMYPINVYFFRIVMGNHYGDRLKGERIVKQIHFYSLLVFEYISIQQIPVPE